MSDQVGKNKGLSKIVATTSKIEELNRELLRLQQKPDDELYGRKSVRSESLFTRVKKYMQRLL